MKHLIILFIGMALLTGCIVNKHKKQAYNEGFEFLFEKELNHRVNDCIAAFQRDGFLYFFTNYYNNLYKVTIYKPNTGKFVEMPIVQEQTQSCKTVVNTFEETRQPLWLRVAQFKSKEFQSLFDNYQKDPASLKEAIDYHPITFRHDTYWHGKKTATLTRKSFQASTLEDVIDHLD